MESNTVTIDTLAAALKSHAKAHVELHGEAGKIDPKHKAPPFAVTLFVSGDRRQFKPVKGAKEGDSDGEVNVFDQALETAIAKCGFTGEVQARTDVGAEVRFSA